MTQQRPSGGILLTDDLVMIITPDGRLHYGKVVRVMDEPDKEGDKHSHLEICHGDCAGSGTTWKVEAEALGKIPAIFPVPEDPNK